MSDFESWLDAPGLDGYEISDRSRLRRVADGKIIKQNLIKGRYMAVLWIKNRPVNITPYRLAAQAFLPNPDNLPEVKHRDGDNTNDRVSNLEWSARTRSGNPRSGENHGRAILRKADVLSIRAKRREGWSFQELADEFGVSIGCIQGAVTKNWKNVEK